MKTSNLYSSISTPLLLVPNLPLVMECTYIIQKLCKNISKFLAHVQLYFVPSILSSTLDDSMNFDVTCSIDIHPVPIQHTHTHTHTENLENTTWNRKKTARF